MKDGKYHITTQIFPGGKEVSVFQTEDGLRDWFAGMAMKDCPVDAYDHAGSAKWCYDRASAMLAEREKK